MARKPYPGDLSDLPWSDVGHLIPGPKPGGRPAKYARREVVAAVFYLLRTGCSWRPLPRDFPPWETAYGYVRRWQADGPWRRVHDALRAEVRSLAGRAPAPTAGALDSRTVGTTDRGGPRGWDGGKKGDRPQAAPGRRRPRAAPGRGRPPGRRPGPGRGPAGPGEGPG